MTTRCITCWIHTCCALSSSRGFYQLYPSILSLPFDLSSSRSRSIPSESSNDETLDYYINNAANSVYCVFLSRSLTSILFLSLSYSFTSLLLIAHTRNFSLLSFSFSLLLHFLFFTLILHHLLTVFSLTRSFLFLHSRSSSFARSSFSCSRVHFFPLSYSFNSSFLSHLHSRSLHLLRSLSLTLSCSPGDWRPAVNWNRYRDAPQLGSMRSRVPDAYIHACVHEFRGGCRHSFPGRAVKTVKTTARTDTSFRDVHERRPPKTGCRHDRHHGGCGEGGGWWGVKS